MYVDESRTMLRQACSQNERNGHDFCHAEWPDCCQFGVNLQTFETSPMQNGAGLRGASN